MVSHLQADVLEPYSEKNQLLEILDQVPSKINIYENDKTTSIELFCSKNKTDPIIKNLMVGVNLKYKKSLTVVAVESVLEIDEGKVQEVQESCKDILWFEKYFVKEMKKLLNASGFYSFCSKKDEEWDQNRTSAIVNK